VEQEEAKLALAGVVFVGSILFGPVLVAWAASAIGVRPIEFHDDDRHIGPCIRHLQDAFLAETEIVRLGEFWQAVERQGYRRIAAEVLPRRARLYPIARHSGRVEEGRGCMSCVSAPSIDPIRRPILTGRALAIRLVAAEVRTPDDLDGAFQALASHGLDVVIVLQTSMLLGERRKIAGLVAAMRLPIIYGYREHVIDGGLIGLESICGSVFAGPVLSIFVGPSRICTARRLPVCL
jgi:hypothetical protein